MSEELFDLNKSILPFITQHNRVVLEHFIIHLSSSLSKFVAYIRTSYSRLTAMDFKKGNFFTVFLNNFDITLIALLQPCHLLVRKISEFVVASQSVV